MFFLKSLFNGAIILTMFSGGFYVRHQLDPAFEAVERFGETRQNAATLWPF